MVRSPDTMKLIPEGGADVPLTVYWRRRIAMADVLVVEPEPPKPAPIKKTARKDVEE
jgi:hypothetical protein